uniref:uncharacterized protein LOC122587786 n=1 Tax=Erigeron canadensis TaxID=72917 RepID=UPI001CB90AA0|nr:uncharacterized protein LOC122587786 [Erigeron canadensis]
MWSNECPLNKIITPRQIKQAGFSLQDKIYDVVRDGNWLWLVAWYDLFPVLLNIAPCTLQQHHKDSITWKNLDGSQVPFSSHEVCEALRDRQGQIDWAPIVWFSQCIPRHAFFLWLVIGRKLKTHDKMKQWDAGGNTNINLLCCSLCKSGPDSHEHLFFECKYSLQVWNSVKQIAGMHHISAKSDDVVACLLPRARSNSAKNVIGKLLVAASVYFVWQERNNMMFSSKVRSATQLKDVIVSTVRLKMATLNFKNTNQVKHLLDGWRLPTQLLVI